MELKLKDTARLFGHRPRSIEASTFAEVSVEEGCATKRGMRQAWVILFTLVAAAVGENPASAHAPYYTVVEKIRLPNGETGEVKLLNGDGILGPDPVRVLVVEPEGKLIALSDYSDAIAVLCSEDGDCTILDGWGGRVLEVDGKSLRADASFPVLSNSERDDLLGLEAIPTSWGFVSRSPTWREWLAGHVVLVLERGYALVFTVTIGFIIGSFIRAGTIVYATERARWTESAAAATAMVGLAAVGAFLTGLTGLLNYKAGLIAVIWLPCLVLGAVSLWWFASRFRWGSQG